METAHRDVETFDEQDCELSPINVSTANRDFTALQYALFVSLFIQVSYHLLTTRLLFVTKENVRHLKKKVIGAFAFIATSWTIIEDKAEVDRVSSLKGSQKVPSSNDYSGVVLEMSEKNQTEITSF